MDEVLDMTFDQIQIAASSITMVKVEWVNSLIEPLMGALGSEYKPASSSDGPAKAAARRKNLSDEDRVSRETGKLAGLASLGIPVL